MENAKQIWQEQGIPGELNFWRRVLEGIKGNETTVPPMVITRMKRRLSYGRELQDYPRLLLSETIASADDTVKILDAGAGPFTQIGSIWPGYKTEVTATDALAPNYDKLLKEYNVAPPVRTKKCDFESLASLFGEDYFDLVWSQNALDHSYDPVSGLENLISVAKPGCYVSIMLFENEGERENYKGMHQWNFSRLNDDISISTKKGDRYMLSDIAKNKADIISIRNVTYFHDEDTGGIETLTEEQVNAIKEKNKNTYIWMQFLLKKINHAS